MVGLENGRWCGRWWKGDMKKSWGIVGGGMKKKQVGRLGR